MKVKLLKKIRSRFKWEFYEKPYAYGKFGKKTVCIVYDKENIEPIEMPLKNKLSYQFFNNTISKVTPAEEMCALVMNSWSLVFKHRSNMFYRLNKSFKLNHFKPN